MDRALFSLHSYILDRPAFVAVERCPPQQDCCKSHAALHSAINIVLDIVEAHKTCTTSCTAPSLPYLIRAALEQVNRKTAWEHDNWSQSAEQRLRTSLDHFPKQREEDGLDLQDTSHHYSVIDTR
jgi:hypothetical protein